MILLFTEQPDQGNAVHQQVAPVLVRHHLHQAVCGGHSRRHSDPQSRAAGRNMTVNNLALAKDDMQIFSKQPLYKESITTRVNDQESDLFNSD